MTYLLCHQRTLWAILTPMHTHAHTHTHTHAVIVYLVMFRLEELGMGHLKKLLNTQHTGKMHKVKNQFL